MRKRQIQAGIDEAFYELLKQEAEEQQRSVNKYAGILIRKGWEVVHGKVQEG